MPRWNGKPDLTAIQLQERKRRRMMMRRMYGMPNSKGTPPRQFTGAGESVFKPMPWHIPSPWELMVGFLSFLPGSRRRKRETELAQGQKSQSMKARGRN